MWNDIHRRLTPTGRARCRRKQFMARRAVDVVGDLVMTVARTGRSSGLEHQDRGTSRRWPMLHSSRNDEDVASMQVNGPRAAVRVPKGDVEVAVQNQEELVGVVVDVPDMLALHLGDSNVIVVDARDDARAPQVVERLERGIEIEGCVCHATSLPPIHRRWTAYGLLPESDGAGGGRDAG